MYTINSYAHSFRSRTTSKGVVYDVIFRIIDNGVERQKVLSGYATKKLAEKAYLEFISKNCLYKERDNNFDYKKTYIKFQEAAKKFIDYSMHAVTAATTIKRKSYFDHYYLPTFGNKNIESIKSKDIYIWFDSVLASDKLSGKGKYSPVTLKSIWGQLYTFFVWCSNRYSINNPMAGLKQPIMKPIEKPIEFWDSDQFNTFISNVDDIFWKTFFMFQYYTGCRIGESLALSENDYKKDSIHIYKSLSKKNLNGKRYEIKVTKNNKSRTIPLPLILKSQLNEYIKWKRKHSISPKFLFNGNDGDYLPHSNIRRVFDYYTELSGLNRIRIHDLRHSYVSLLIHKGANLAVIASLIGDTLEQITKTYGHMYESDRIRTVNLIDD